MKRENLNTNKFTKKKKKDLKNYLAKMLMNQF